jgi:hypothetical protein
VKLNDAELNPTDVVVNTGVVGGGKGRVVALIRLDT